MKKATSGETTPKGLTEKRLNKLVKDLKKELKEPPSIDDLDYVLYEMETYFERLVIPLFLRGETLRTMKNKGQVDGYKIELLTLKRYLTKEVRSFLKEWGFEVTPRRIKKTIKDIPVVVKVLKRRPSWLESPDRMHYKVTSFLTPNPWKMGL